MPKKQPRNGKFDPFADGFGQKPSRSKPQKPIPDDGIFSGDMIRGLSEDPDARIRGPIDKGMRNRQILFFLLLTLLICALGGVVVAAWYVRHHEAAPAAKEQTAAESAPAARPTFVEGAYLGSPIKLPNGYAPLAIEVDPEIGNVYVLMVNSDSEGFHQFLFTNNLLKPVEWEKKELEDVSGNQVFDDPHNRLCTVATNAHCPVNQNAHHRSVIADDSHTFELSMKDSYWHLDDKTFDADLVFGLLDKDLMLGAKNTDAIIGLSPEGSTPVNEVTAYSIDSTEPVWNLKLDGMSLVAANKKFAAVVACDNLAADKDSVWRMGQAMSEHSVEAFLGKDNRCQVQEIVPAKRGEAKSKPPETTDKTDYEQITKVDFGARTWVVPNNVETGTTAELKDGKYVIPRVPAGVDPSGYDLSKPIWSIGAQGFNDGDDKKPIIYGDINGDGYIDALVPITYSEAYRHSEEWKNYVYVWFWDPQKNQAVQYQQPLTTSARCGDQYVSFHFADIGRVEATKKVWKSSDKCGSGPSGDELVVFKYDPHEKRLSAK